MNTTPALPALDAAQNSASPTDGPPAPDTQTTNLPNTASPQADARTSDSPTQTSNLQRPLLILDLDEALVHAKDDGPLPDRAADLMIAGDIHVYIRPHLDQFIARAWVNYDVAIWSKGGAGYVEPTVRALFQSHRQPVFVWSFSRCTRRFDHEAHEAYYIKDLKKVRNRGFAKERMLIVDDLELNAMRNFGNAIYIRPWEGDLNDRELLHLATYLEELAPHPNFRTIEKRYWRDRFANGS